MNDKKIKNVRKIKRELFSTLNRENDFDKETNDRLDLFIEGRFVKQNTRPLMYVIATLLLICITQSYLLTASSTDESNTPSQNTRVDIQLKEPATLYSYSKASNEYNEERYIYDFKTASGQVVQIRNVRRKFSFDEAVTIDIDVKNQKSSTAYQFSNTSVRYVHTRDGELILEIR